MSSSSSGVCWKTHGMAVVVSPLEELWVLWVVRPWAWKCFLRGWWGVLRGVTGIRLGDVGKVGALLHWKTSGVFGRLARGVGFGTWFRSGNSRWVGFVARQVYGDPGLRSAAPIQESEYLYIPTGHALLYLLLHVDPIRRQFGIRYVLRCAAIRIRPAVDRHLKHRSQLRELLHAVESTISSQRRPVVVAVDCFGRALGMPFLYSHDPND